MIRTAYQVFHHENPVSEEYDSMAEAELFRVFFTPGTPDYTIQLVRVTDPTPDGIREAEGFTMVHAAVLG